MHPAQHSLIITITIINYQRRIPFFFTLFTYSGQREETKSTLPPWTVLQTPTTHCRLSLPTLSYYSQGVTIWWGRARLSSSMLPWWAESLCLRGGPSTANSPLPRPVPGGRPALVQVTDSAPECPVSFQGRSWTTDLFFLFCMKSARSLHPCSWLSPIDVSSERRE